MFKQKGFTIIEMLVFFVISLTVLTMIANAIGFTSGNNSVSFGINGMTESRCIEGYKFVIGEQGQPRQILDEFGKGVRCETKVKPGGF